MSWDWEKLQEQKHKRGVSPPQIDEFFQKLNEFKIPGGPVIIILVAASVLALSSMFYTVEVDEVGVVQRFGKFHHLTDPGLNIKIPFGIDRVTKVKIQRVYKEEFGVPTTQSDRRSGFIGSSDDVNDETLMLTGDLNVALVPWIVQYKIKNPVDYLFKVQNVNLLLRDMSEAAMRIVVGDRSINEVISKREEIAIEAKELLQAEMDKAETGIDISTIEMKRTNVPVPVQPSFNEVNQAIQEKEKLIYQAKEEYNKAIPAARGEAEKIIKSAEGYALDRVNRAEGDAARFRKIYAEYVKAQDVTKRRMYLETLKTVFPKLGHKYIIDADQKNVLPFLNMGLPDAGQAITEITAGEK